jgi:hypothetical protein
MRLMSALLLAALSAPAAIGDAPEAASELKAYYQNGKNEPPWRAAVSRLATEDGPRRDVAAAYLRTLLDQALKDEVSGAAPWLATPFWGSSGQNPARELRKSIAAALFEAAATPAAIPVARWFLDHEKLSQLQATALGAVAKIEGKEADAVLLRLALAPHPNAAVVVKSLEEVARRKLPVKADVLAPSASTTASASARPPARPVTGSVCRSLPISIQ